MRWRRLGHVFVAHGAHPQMRTHAALPTALRVGPDHFRVYYSARDQANRSSIGFVEIDPRWPTRPTHAPAAPVLTPGDHGQFDGDGVSVSCAVPRAGSVYLYYLGWNLARGAAWRNTIGLAISEDGGVTFRKHSKAPIVDLGEEDPFTLSYPWVAGGDGRWEMWYGSDLRRRSGQDDMAHILKHAESGDGATWSRNRRVALGLKAGEIGLSRPCVLRENGRYRMWYAYRGDRYRIGYAECERGEPWRRLDEIAGIEPSGSGWDSDAVCYPCVFEHRGEKYMLYNGDGYGRTGFGIALLEAD
jgi:hypothetical protein